MLAGMTDKSLLKIQSGLLISRCYTEGLERAGSSAAFLRPPSKPNPAWLQLGHAWMGLENRNQF